MPGYDKPGSDAFQKIMECLKNLTRSTASLLIFTETLRVADIQYGASSVKPVKVKKLALTAADTAGGLFDWAPGVAVIVERVVLDITTASTGACTADVGVAANGTTSNDTLLDGQSLNATGLLDNVENKGTNGKARQRVGATQHVTGSVASGASAGVVGNVYIHYVEV